MTPPFLDVTILRKNMSIKTDNNYRCENLMYKRKNLLILEWNQEIEGIL